MPHGKIEALAAMIDKASKIAFFTGAGISTESGIPDFRSPGTGLWNKVTPIDFQDFVSSEAKRKESWGRRFSGEHRVWAEAKPNKGHLAVARLVEMNKCIGVITQNVDNLHQHGGVPADKVIELHGNNSFATCLSCATRYELADLEQQSR